MIEHKHASWVLLFLSLAACETRVEVLHPRGTADAGLPDAAVVDASVATGCAACGAQQLCAVDHCVDTEGTTALGSGLRHVCAVKDAGLWCWGNNGASQLGVGGVVDRVAPAHVGMPGNWLAVAGGQQHSCGLRAQGTLFCWGDNSTGQLGLGDTRPRGRPARVAAPTDFTDLACGGDNCCALRAGGTLYCWGDNHTGSPGQGDSPSAPDILTPSPVALGLRYVRVSVGEAHSCAIVDDGSLRCWGRNSDGQLGIGAVPSRQREPAAVGGMRGWRDIAAGQHHTCGIRGRGELYCWGTNDFFELGLGRSSPDGATVDAEPVRVGSDDDWSSVAVGWFHSCALKQSGALYCWGRASEGQLGNATGAPVPMPTPTAPSKRFAKLALGSFHSCALDTDGQVFCWGTNTDGQLGVNDTQPRSQPTHVPF